MAKFEEADERWIVREREDGTNVNGWHWTNKDMSARSTAQLRATLEAFSCTAPLTADVGAPVVRVSLQSVSVSGTVEALNRKGRRFLLYELDVSADWKAVLEPAHGPPVPAEPSATAAGEDDEALARRLQAEEDALSAAALSEGGCVLGRLSASDWTHDEEDEPPFQLERKSSEPFVPPVSADGVYGLVRKLLPRACAGALKGWAVLVRQDATQPGGPTQGNDAPLTNPPPPPPAQPAPAPPPAAAAPEPRASVGGGGGVSRASDDPAELCREAIGAYCTKQRLSSGSASELSLRGLRLGTSEAAIVCRLLRMDESRALRSLDLSHNALGDQGLDELVEALAAGGGAHALARLCLGANANISREARESACARLRAARPLLEVSWDGNDAAAAGGGAGGGAGNARPFISVGVVHAGSPAEAAGLREGDALLRVGGLSAASFVSIESSVVPLIKEHKGNALNVVAMRRTGEEVRLTLQPRAWEGNGLLGCVLHPLL